MWSSMIAFQKICLAVTICKTTHAFHLPELGISRQSPLQQSLSEVHAAKEADLDFFANPYNLDELFRSLTTDDALPAFDYVPTMEPNSKFRQIVLGYHNTGESSEPSAPRTMDSDHPASLQISMSTIGGYPVYQTPIAIGNPAQPFRAWLNMNLDGLYVRSTACAKSDCGQGFAYDPKKSTTRKSSGHRFKVHPKDWTVGGNVSTDTLHLASVDVTIATVGEIDEYWGEDLFYYVMEFTADGALGLATPNAKTSAYSPLTAPNPLYELMESHALEHNTLTLTLPSTTKDCGALRLGLPPQASGNMIRIPFANATDSGLDNSWHVSLDSVSLGSQDKLHLPLANVYGRLDLEPAIRLPPSTTEAIYKAIGARPGSLFRGATIDCRAREKLPDLILNIGGNEVKLTRDEYSSEQAVYTHPVCVVAILPSESEGIAVLGINLLRKYHVMIDIDGNELGLIARTE